MPLLLEDQLKRHSAKAAFCHFTDSDGLAAERVGVWELFVSGKILIMEKLAKTWRNPFRCMSPIAAPFVVCGAIRSRPRPRPLIGSPRLNTCSARVLETRTGLTTPVLSSRKRAHTQHATHACIHCAGRSPPCCAGRPTSPSHEPFSDSATPPPHL